MERKYGWLFVHHFLHHILDLLFCHFGCRRRHLHFHHVHGFDLGELLLDHSHLLLHLHLTLLEGLHVLGVGAALSTVIAWVLNTNLGLPSRIPFPFHPLHTADLSKSILVTSVLTTHTDGALRHLTSFTHWSLRRGDYTRLHHCLIHCISTASEHHIGSDLHDAGGPT